MFLGQYLVATTRVTTINQQAIAILFAAITVLLSACAGSGTPVARGALNSYSIDVDGRERTYLFYTPAKTPAFSGKRPLILVFHGGGGTARGIAKEVGRSLHPIADREGILVAYPHAVDKMWDFGAGKVSESLDVRIDDRSYFGELLTHLVRMKPVDENRVFATGISRGGQASYFVACQFADRIRAIAAVAMPMPKFMKESCAAEPGMGVAILNGTEDPLVPYNGGEITVGRRERGEVMSTDDTVEFWLSRNSCSREPTDHQTIDTASDRMQVHRTSWERCEHDPVLLYRIEGGGHTWPSGRQYLPKFVVGPVNRDIDAAHEVWSFFSQFR